MEENKINYVRPIKIISALEKIMGMKYEELKTFVKNSSIKVSKEDISKYLIKTLEKENPKLKERIENCAQKFGDHYGFYTLEYYQNYINVVKTKTLVLLELIELLALKNTEHIKKVLENLDINLDKDGNILELDMNRLVKPVIENINDLCQILLMANNLENYKNGKKGPKKLLQESFPDPCLQIKNLEYDNLRGYIPLSEKQKIELEKNWHKNIIENIEYKLNIPRKK